METLRTTSARRVLSGFVLTTLASIAIDARASVAQDLLPLSVLGLALQPPQDRPPLVELEPVRWGVQFGLTPRWRMPSIAADVLLGVAHEDRSAVDISGSELRVGVSG